MRRWPTPRPVEGIGVTIQELLDEIEQRPDVEYELDRWIIPLFNRMLKEHGFEFLLLDLKGDFMRCKIQRISSGK